MHSFKETKLMKCDADLISEIVMDIEKLTNGRIGDFEVRVNNASLDDIDETSNSIARAG